MKIAAIYDIHGNIPALEAVLAEIQQEKVDLILVGGDVVAGPMPAEAIDQLWDIQKQTPMQLIHGNAESELMRYIKGEPVNGLSPHAESIAEWVSQQPTPQHISFIQTWSGTL